MTKTLRICGQFAFVIILDLLVIGYIFLASEQKKAFDANAKSAEIIPAKLFDPRTGLEINRRTRLIVGEGYAVVEKECAQCHPTQIIRSYRANRSDWLDAIRWMQAEKGLKKFDKKTEDIILTDLENYYGK